MLYYLAPMEEITGYVYRNVHHALFGDIDRYFTPFITPTKKKKLKSKEQKEVDPANNQGMDVVPQILTREAGQLIDTAEMLFSLGYREVNLNLGCPSATVVTKHKGAGFLADTDALDAFFEAVFAHSLFKEQQMRLSVKSRLGLFSADEFPEILEIFNRYPLSEVILHPRVRTDFYKNTPDLSAFDDALAASAHPLCYNGDINSVRDYDAFRARFPSVDRIMIGRGLAANPALIREIRTGEKLRKEELAAYERALCDGYVESYHDANNALYKMKEVWFYMGKMFDHPEKMLKKVLKSRTPDQYRSAADEAFAVLELAEY